LQWGGSFDRFFAVNAKRYGTPFSANFPSYGKVVCFASSRAAKQLLTASPHDVHAGEAYEILRQSAGSSSLLLLDEDEHLRMRKLLMPPLHGERLQVWREFVEMRTLQEIEAWPLREPLKLRPAMQRITLDVIMRIVFGIRDLRRAQELRGLLPVLFDVGLGQGAGYVYPWARLDLGPRSPWGRFRRKRDRIDALLAAEIAQRRREFAAVGFAEAEQGSREDVLSMLLVAEHDDGSRLTDAELRDHLVTMLVAGHETTATSLAWAFERLLRNSEILQRLEDDLTAGSTTYLDAVIKETMRIRPVVAQIGRVLKREMTIDGWSIPAETMVMLPMSLIHSDPVLYPEPEEFRPERYLGDEELGSYVWLPFGGGVRRCIGASLALMEMRVVITTILRHLRLTPDRPQAEWPRAHGITLVPSRGGKVIATERLTRNLGERRGAVPA